jgi:hypothetical protein
MTTLPSSDLVCVMVVSPLELFVLHLAPLAGRGRITSQM